MSFLGKRALNVEKKDERPSQSVVPTTESLRTVFFSHLPPSYTNINSISEAQRKIEDLLAQHVGPNNVQRVKILGEGRAKVVFKMSIWAKQILKVMNGATLKNDEEWLARQEKQVEKARKDSESFEADQDLEGEYEGNDKNREVQFIVPLGKDHFGKKTDTKTIVKKTSQVDIDDLRTAEYTVRVIGHEEKLENAQKLANRSRDVVVKAIPKSLTLKEVEKKLAAWLGSIGVITNIRIPAKHNNVQEHSGYAFVSFNRPRHAEMAIEKKNGRMFEGVKLIIEPKMQRDEYLKQKEDSKLNQEFVIEVTPEEIENRKQKERELKKLEQKEERDRIEREKLERLYRLREGVAFNEPKSSDAPSKSEDPKSKKLGKTSQKVESKEKDAMSDDEDSIQGFDTDSESDDDLDKKSTMLNKIEIVNSIPEASTKAKAKSEEQIKYEDEIQRTIFVRNIPVGATEDDVILLFSNFGRVVYAKLVMNRKTNAPTGTGFVLFRDKEGFNKLFQAAKLANILSSVEKKSDLKEKVKAFKKTIAQLPEKTQKRRIKEFYQEEKNNANHKENSNFFTVDSLTLQSSQLYFAKAMTRDNAKEKLLEKELEKARDKRKLHLATEGFIPKDSPAAIGIPEAFLKKLEEKYIEKQKRLRSNPSLHINDRRLKVGYIPKTWDHKQFKSVVVKYVKEATGKIPKLSQVIILKDEKGKSKGMGFLEFETHEMALAALRELNNNPNVYSNGRLYLEFAIDDLVKIHKMKYKSASVQYDSGPVSKNRINRIVNKLEDKETMDRISRVMEASKPFQYKRKRDDNDNHRSRKRQRSE